MPSPCEQESRNVWPCTCRTSALSCTEYNITGSPFPLRLHRHFPISFTSLSSLHSPIFILPILPLPSSVPFFPQFPPSFHSPSSVPSSTPPHYNTLGGYPAMPNRVTSYHVMSSHVMSHHVTSCHVMSRHVISRHVKSRHVASCHIMSRHVTSWHVMSGHVTPCHVMSRHVSHVMSRHGKQNLPVGHSLLPRSRNTSLFAFLQTSLI